MIVQRPTASSTGTQLATSQPSELHKRNPQYHIPVDRPLGNLRLWERPTLMVPTGSSLKVRKPRYIQTKRKDLFHGALFRGIKFNKQIHTQHLWGVRGQGGSGRRSFGVDLPITSPAERQQRHLLGPFPPTSSLIKNVKLGLDWPGLRDSPLGESTGPTGFRWLLL